MPVVDFIVVDPDPTLDIVVSIVVALVDDFVVVVIDFIVVAADPAPERVVPIVVALVVDLIVVVIGSIPVVPNSTSGIVVSVAEIVWIHYRHNLAL